MTSTELIDLILKGEDNEVKEVGVVGDLAQALHNVCGPQLLDLFHRYSGHKPTISSFSLHKLAKHCGLPLS